MQEVQFVTLHYMGACISANDGDVGGEVSCMKDIFGLYHDDAYSI